MISEDHSQRKGQGCDTSGQAQVTITKVTYKKNGIRPKLLKQMLIGITPGAVEIAGNSEAQVRQGSCLGCDHPASVRTP